MRELIHTIFLKFAVFFLLLTDISNANLLKPNTALKPIDVLKIQLDSLKNNNVPGVSLTVKFSSVTQK